MYSFDVPSINFLVTSFPSASFTNNPLLLVKALSIKLLNKSGALDSSSKVVTSVDWETSFDSSEYVVKG